MKELISSKPIRIAISGANGRMGRELIKEVVRSKQVLLGAALSRSDSIVCGMDVGEIAKISMLNIIINGNINLIRDDFDIFIDFTSPDATLKYLDFCQKNNKNMVIGTTGFNCAQKEIINIASQKIGIVFSSNFSIGINVMFNLLQKISRIIGEESDIEIIDMHHRYKKDEPSGTALNMGEIIANELGINFSSYALHDNKGKIGQQKDRKGIGFSTIRVGDVIGDHTVIFAKDGEQLNVTHKASSRVIFAIGAIRAAIWLYNYKKGLFSMSNVLNINGT